MTKENSASKIQFQKAIDQVKSVCQLVTKGWRESLLLMLVLLANACIPENKTHATGSVSGELVASSSAKVVNNISVHTMANSTMPVAGVVCTIEGTSNSGTTDETGFFRIDNVLPGSHILICKKEGYAFLKVIEVTAEQVLNIGVIEIVLMGKIKGKALLHGLADPIGITVYTPGTSLQAKTDAEGMYLLDNIPQGTYPLRFEYPGYLSTTLSSVEVFAGRTTLVSDITLSLSTGVSGNIVINDGSLYSAFRTVMVSVNASRDATQMQISADPNFLGASWVTVVPSLSYVFTSDGEKRLYVKFANANGLETAPVSSQIIVDTLPPTGSLMINSGEALVYSTNVTLTLLLADMSAMNEVEMMISNTADFTNAIWEPFVNTKPWVLTAGEGLKTVYVKFKDRAGNETNPAVYAYITLGQIQAPTQVQAVADKGQVTLSWDLVLGATSYNVYMASVGGITKDNFNFLPDHMVHVVSASPFIHTGLTNGETYFFVVTAMNANGESNFSAEVSATPVDTSFVALALGENHSCALIGSGKVKCWGANYAGQLGRGVAGSPTAETSQPAEVAGIATAVAITAGRYHTCALLSSGAVQCWGENRLGQLGNGGTVSSLTPVSVNGIGGLSPAKAVVAGEEFTCALLLDGTAKCWGKNLDGQLGIGNILDSPEPVVVSQINEASFMAAGYDYACSDAQSGATPQDRRVRCWGKNTSGQLGNNSVINASLPVDVVNFIDAQGIATTIASALTAGETHTCALILDGSVNCWGSGKFGQLGNNSIGSKAKSNIPVRVSVMTGVVGISAGQNHTCAVTSANAVSCWGRNHLGQLGNGTLLDSGVATLVQGLSAQVIAAGENHTCAILTDGSVKCWGANGFGQLGNGEFANADLPQDVVGVSGATAVGAGEDHACALVAGRVKCWGSNESGQLGNGALTNALTPVDVADITTATGIAVGGNHSCALLSDGSMKCWGKNKDGQVGNGVKVNTSIPVPVTGIAGVTELTGGMSHTCAMTLPLGNNVKCWGKNKSGQLGNGGTVDALLPIDSAPLSLTATAIKVIGGENHTCGILSDGTMSCWGQNDFGQLGIGSLGLLPVTTPQVVGGASPSMNIKAASAGGNHTCAVASDGSVQCWGRNVSGQLGAGLFGAAIPLPGFVQGMEPGETATMVSAGADHTCAVMTSGRVKCWGDNELGGLGNGTNRNAAIATALPPSVLATAVAAGKNFSCATINNDTVKCWGSNRYGQLGTGIAGFQSLPVAVLGTP